MIKINYMAFPGVTDFNANIQTVFKRLITDVCKLYRINKKDLFSKSRLRENVEARQIVMYLLKTKYNQSLTRIGKMFEKNHATVISACTKIENIMSYDEEFKNKVNSLI